MKTLLLLVGPVCAALSAHAQNASRPNVLVILTDDMRWDAMGVVQREQGAAALFPWLKTPNLDRLAAEGTRFSSYFTTFSLCSPSRASIISGQYAHKHGVRNNFTEFPVALASFPRRLQEAGYETAYIGKWHMGEENDQPRPGFDYWLSHRGQGNYWDNEFNENGRRHVRKGYYTTVVTDAALEWLQKPHEKPWMMVLGQKAPHGGPIVPEPKYEHAFDAEPVKKPANAEDYKGNGKPPWLETSYPTWHGTGGPLYGQKEYGKFVRAYLGCIASIDDAVGRLYETLQKNGQLDNTVLIFTSDNGFAIGEHGRVDKRTAYEESLRIPLLVRYPKAAPAGKVVPQMVLTLDIAPTILEWCGAGTLPQADGRSFTGLLAGQTDGWRTHFFYQYNYETQFPFTPNVRAIRTERDKFIRYPHGDGTPDRHPVEYYHLVSDPLEQRNGANEPAHKERIAELAKKLEAFMQSPGGPPDTMTVDEGIVNVLPKF